MLRWTVEADGVGHDVLVVPFEYVHETLEEMNIVSGDAVWPGAGVEVVHENCESLQAAFAISTV
jgi:hypothetical protein